ncbi:hypothetical protein [Lichenifustis flavocetrariae]|uniref:Uncharacterized protein n=1 Tax=Lichenifustis flavocetrariae TaxID=2949735 RepID=A0AA41ZA57_9HYPH|nr:hypothetical protein [Lichenifustis flavocetrariae]MCW6513105.1 hypothetical protein [Lichenifustis flavocetrariae]
MKLAPGPKRRIDILQNELDHGRISPQAFDAGRVVQDVIERAHAAVGSRWADFVDTSMQPGAASVHGLDAARQAVKMMARLRLAIGPVDATIVRLVVGDGLTFEQVATAQGRAGARSVAYFAARFRDALEELAKASIAVGKVSKVHVDNYSDMAIRTARR